MILGVSMGFKSIFYAYGYSCDNIKDNGSYGGFVYNHPFVNIESCMILVFNNSREIIQIAIGFGSGQIYSRSYQESWSNWIRA